MLAGGGLAIRVGFGVCDKLILVPIEDDSGLTNRQDAKTGVEMAIYGTALLSLCLLVGLIVGRLLGVLVGVEANVGGVGIAMLLLILICDRLQQSGRLKRPSERGIAFWSSIYIPIVVAMAASQNVLAAIEGGPVAILAGVLAVIAGFSLVPLIGRLGRSNSPPPRSIAFPLKDE